MKYSDLGGKNNIRKALEYHDKEILLSIQMDSAKDVAIAQRFKGDCFRKLNKFREAKSCYLESINVTRREYNMEEFKLLNDGKIIDLSLDDADLYKLVEYCEDIIEYQRCLCNLCQTYLDRV